MKITLKHREREREKNEIQLFHDVLTINIISSKFGQPVLKNLTGRKWPPDLSLLTPERQQSLSNVGGSRVTAYNLNKDGPE